MTLTKPAGSRHRWVPKDRLLGEVLRGCICCFTQSREPCGSPSSRFTFCLSCCSTGRVRRGFLGDTSRRAAGALYAWPWPPSSPQTLVHSADVGAPAPGRTSQPHCSTFGRVGGLLLRYARIGLMLFVALVV